MNILTKVSLPPSQMDLHLHTTQGEVTKESKDHPDFGPARSLTHSHLGDCETKCCPSLQLCGPGKKSNTDHPNLK